MKNRLKGNKAGSTLVWAIVILLVVSIVVTAVLTISLSYTTRSTDNNAKRQAYFTARSVVDAIAEELCGNTENGKEILSKLEESTSLHINSFAFEGESGTVAAMGSCTAALEKRDDDTILITAAAKVGTQTESVTLQLLRNRGYGFSGLAANQFDITGNLLTTKGNDIYVMGDIRTSLTGKIVLKGNLYSRPKIDINFASGSEISGDMISDLSITLVGSANITGAVYSKDIIMDVNDTLPEEKKHEYQTVSRVPNVVKPELPELPEEGAELLVAEDKDKELGEPHKDSFYQVSENMNLGELKTVEGAQDIFIYVDDGVVLSTDGMEKREDTRKNPPNFYFILGRECQVICVKDEAYFYGYIFNDHKSNIADVIFVVNKTTFCGGVYADKFSHTGNLDFVSMDAAGNPGAKGKWSKLQYLTEEEALPT